MFLGLVISIKNFIARVITNIIKVLKIYFLKDFVIITYDHQELILSVKYKNYKAL